MQQVAHEDEILRVQGPVKTVALNQAFAQGLAGRWIDHDIDRVANGIDANKHQHRHRHDDQHRLQQALYEEADHRGAFAGDVGEKPHHPRLTRRGGTAQPVNALA